MLYCVPAITAYAVDLALRFRYSRAGAGQIVAAEYFEEAEITRLTLQPGRNFRPVGPGHFITINLRALDRYPGIVLESHPFSVSSHLPDGKFTCHIKNMGAGTWTGRLALAAREGRLPLSEAQVDGPFGRLSPALPNAGRSVFLICGGVGVTPMLNILQHLIEEPALLHPGRRVVFVWSVRFANQIEPFADTLQSLSAASTSIAPMDPGPCEPRPSISIRIFETGRSPDMPTAVVPTAPAQNSMENAGFTSSEAGPPDSSLPSPSDDHPLLERSFGRLPPMSELPLSGTSARGSLTLHTEPGRPPMSQILRCEDGEIPDDVTVYVCGPPALVSDIETRCHIAGFVCHAETFLF